MNTSITRRAFLVCFSLIALCAFVTACGGGSSSSLNASGGSVQIRVSASGAAGLLEALPADALATASGGSGGSGITALDHPPGSNRPQLQSFEITFSSISARNSAGELVPVAIALPITVDALALSSGNPVELPVGFLPADTYQGFVVNVSVVALVLQNGTRITIEPPGEGWTADIATRPFTVVEGEPTTVELNLRLNLALQWLRDHFEFRPVFDCNVHGHGDDDSSGSGDR